MKELLAFHSWVSFLDEEKKNTMAGKSLYFKDYIQHVFIYFLFLQIYFKNKYFTMY